MDNLTPEEYIDRLLEIDDLFSEEVDEILERLVEIGEPAIQPMIYHYLGHPDIYYYEEFTCEIGEALGKIGEKAVDALIGALDNDKGILHHNAAYALAQIGNARAIDPLIHAIRTEKSYSALYALGMIGGDRAAQVLLDLLHSDDFERSSIISWLGRTQSDLVFETLVDALGSADSEIRRNAVFSLRDLKQDRGVEALIPLLDDTEHTVRDAVAIVIADDFRDPKAAPVLARYLDHQHAHLRASAAAFIGKTGSTQFVNDLRRLMLKDPDKDVRLSCAVALIELQVADVEKAERLITQAIMHKQGYIRFRAIQALAGVSSPQAKYWLLKGLNDKNPYNRYCAARLLGDIGDVDVLETLKAHYGDEKHRITKKALLEAIKKIEDH